MSFARRGLLALVLLSAATVHAQKSETVKIAVIDPLSGLAAVTGVNQLKTAEFFAGVLNRSRGGNEPRYEVFGLDSSSVSVTARPLMIGEMPEPRVCGEKPPLIDLSCIATVTAASYGGVGTLQAPGCSGFGDAMT